jgi:CRP-like cAMP-binding protein
MANINSEKFTAQLALVELFNELSPEELQLLESIVTKESFSAGQAIVKEAEYGDKLFMIIRGDVEILKRTVFGDEYTCDYLPEAKHLFFGEFSLLDADVRSATVKAITAVEALVLTRGTFLPFCDSHKEIGYKIMKAVALRLASRLRKADKDIVTLFEALVDEIGSF